MGLNYYQDSQCYRLDTHNLVLYSEKIFEGLTFLLLSTGRHESASLGSQRWASQYCDIFSGKI